MDGRRYLTWTCAGLGFFQQAHWTVWSLDPAKPEQMRLESQLFTRRDGLVLGDHAGQLVRDGDRWLVLTSSWGDFAPGVDPRAAPSSADDLLTGVHVLETERAPLPTEAGSWDPALTRVDGSWRLGFVESPSQEPFDFHPALAATSAGDWTDGLRRKVGRPTELHQCEGPVHRHRGGHRATCWPATRTTRTTRSSTSPAPARPARRAVPDEHPAPAAGAGPGRRLADAHLRRHARGTRT